MYLYLILIIVASLLWMAGIYYWFNSEKKNKFIGLFLIGPLVFMGKDLNREFTVREKYGWLVVILLMVFAVLFTGR